MKELIREHKQGWKFIKKKKSKGCSADHVFIMKSSHCKTMKVSCKLLANAARRVCLSVVWVFLFDVDVEDKAGAVSLQRRFWAQHMQ